MFYHYFMEGNWERRDNLYALATPYSVPINVLLAYCETIMQFLGLAVLHGLGSGYRKWERTADEKWEKMGTEQHYWSPTETAKTDERMGRQVKWTGSLVPVHQKKLGLAFMTIFQLQDMNRKVSQLAQKQGYIAFNNFSWWYEYTYPEQEYNLMSQEYLN